jgi:hypothetical protein
MRSWLRRALVWLGHGPAVAAAGSGPAVAGVMQPGGIARPQRVGARPAPPQRGWRSAHDPARLGEECGAFLAGRVYELAPPRRPFPAWVTLSVLAHASRPEIERLASGATALGTTGPLPSLAADVLGICDRGRVDLDRLQRSVLVPLELVLTRDRSGDADDDRLTYDILSCLCHASELISEPVDPDGD